MKPEHIDKLKLIHLPGLSRIIGDQSFLTYVSIIFVIMTIYLFKKTHLGLAIHSVGESPEISITAGIKNNRIKMGAIIASGILCSLGGAYLSTVVISEFTENMVAGQGFTAFTAVAFGNGNPLVTLLASILLGMADAVGIRLELMGLGISPSLVQMSPYVLALVIYTLSTGIRKLRLKRAIGKSEEKAE
jgi:simple sugar transport system permease protein